MATKLNSMRLLDANSIPYEILEYETDIRDAQEVAERIGVPEFMVFKTLVVQPIGEGKPLLCVIPSDRQLDLKKLAKAAGYKKVQMAKHSDAEKLTGLQVGGISPLALTHKNWQVYLDQSATELQNICLSSGKRGMQLRVPVNALMSITKARIAEISTIE